MSYAANQQNQHIFFGSLTNSHVNSLSSCSLEGIYTVAHCVTLVFILSWLCERKAEQQTKACGINTSKRAIQGVNIKEGELCNVITLKL